MHGRCEDGGGGRIQHRGSPTCKFFTLQWCTSNTHSVEIILQSLNFDLSWVCLLIYSVVSDSLNPPWTVAQQPPLSMGVPSKNTGVGCHFLLQGISLTQGLNLCLLYCRNILYCLSHWGSQELAIHGTYFLMVLDRGRGQQSQSTQ